MKQMRYYRYGSVILLAGVFFLSGCTMPWQKKQPIPSTPTPEQPVATTSAPLDMKQQLLDQSKIKKFQDKQELVAFMEKNSSNSFVTNSIGISGVRNMAFNSASDALWGGKAELAAPQATTKAVADVAAGSGAGESDFSKTNTQVEGVDEADIIKTDGKYVFAINRQQLIIAEAFPAVDAKIVGKIEFKGQPHEMFLSGNRLVVFGSDAGNQLADPASVCNSGKAGCLVPKESPIWGNEFTFAKVYDISDKTKPKLERETATEGSYVDSRLIDGYVYLVTSKATYDTYITDPLPVMLRQGKLVENSIMPPVYYFDMPYESFNFVSVASFKVDDPAQQEKSEVYMMSNAQNIFVSPDNIYITYSKYLNEGKLRMEAMKELLLSKLTETDKQRVAKIEAADEQVLSQNEKLAKEVQIMSRYLMAMLPADQEKFEQEVKNVIKNKFADISQELEKTVIHKIAIKQGNLEYKTAGEVTGSVLNQFAMDESDGYFRIATTKNRTWSSLIDESEKESYSSLFILDKDLKQVGSVTDLAKGERIYSVRFIGKRAYLVTFKQTDPLFVIDLSAPTAPKVLGQLKIPGFSNYLHPYDENTLIGFGKETSISSWGGTITGGLKLSLFDVSQVDKPVELDHYVMGDRGSDSVALNNHKAFLFSKDKNILVLPVSLYQAASKDEWGKFVFGGAMVFSIDNKKFTLKGRIDHSNGGQSGENYYFDGYSYYDNNVLRSLYIKDTLYTLSGRYIKANKLSDLSQISSLDLVELNKREPLGVASSSPSGPIIPLNQPTGTFNSATPNSQGVAAPTPAMPVKDLKKLK